MQWSADALCLSLSNEREFRQVSLLQACNKHVLEMMAACDRS